MPSIAEKLAANASPKCCICAKSVFKTEETQALGKIWHKSCFCCSSTVGNGCKKVLKIMEGYLVHEDVPYCKSCYSKLYAPRGVNSACKDTAVYTSTGTGGAVAAPASDSGSNYINSTLAANFSASEISTEPPKRRISGAASMFESAALAAASSPAPAANVEASSPVSTSTTGAIRRLSAGEMKIGNGRKIVNPDVVSSGGDKVAQELAAAKEAYRLQRAADMADSTGATNSKGVASTQHDKSLPVNSVFAAAHATVATSSPSVSAASPLKPSPAPVAKATATAPKTYDAAYKSFSGSESSAAVSAPDNVPVAKAEGVSSVASKFGVSVGSVGGGGGGGIAAKLAANASPKCCICAKSVFKTEETQALGKIWHKSCFCCSSTVGNGCKKVLKIMEGYLVHDERIPYCKSCYSKLYAPRGVNSACKETAVYTSTASEYEATADSAPAPAAKVATTFAPVVAPVYASSPKTANNAVPTPVVFAAAVAGASDKTEKAVRRGSASEGLNVGGKLKHDIHKEKAADLDGDEVDEGEWD